LIVKNGFDERVSALSGMFGGGIYFAENSSKSNQYVPCSNCNGGAVFSTTNCSCKDQGILGLILCRVALGDVHIALKYDQDKYKGTTERPVRLAPLKANGKRYDAVLGESLQNGGDTLRFREIVIYDRYQVYPEYLVAYKRVCDT